MEANKILLQTLYKNIILEFTKKTGKELEESMDYLNIKVFLRSLYTI